MATKSTGQVVGLAKILVEISKHFRERGSYAEFGREHGISDEYVRQIVAGTRTAPDWFLEHFGFQRVVRYHRINK